MKVNTNNWNIIRYTLYTPGYNLIARLFNESRKKSIDSLELTPGDNVLIIGAGTGLDLEFIPKYCKVTATDITPSMVERIRKNTLKESDDVQAIVMDGHCLRFHDSSFDAIVLHLILAVIPDPVMCLQEAERVLKTGGKITVFDKFLPNERKVSRLRRVANVFTNILFSDITRDFESIVQKSGLTVLSDVDADFGGNFRIIKLTKNQ